MIGVPRMQLTLEKHMFSGVVETWNWKNIICLNRTCMFAKVRVVFFWFASLPYQLISVKVYKNKIKAMVCVQWMQITFEKNKVFWSHRSLKSKNHCFYIENASRNFEFLLFLFYTPKTKKMTFELPASQIFGGGMQIDKTQDSNFCNMHSLLRKQYFCYNFRLGWL